MGERHFPPASLPPHNDATAPGEEGTCGVHTLEEAADATGLQCDEIRVNFAGKLRSSADFIFFREDL